MPDEIIKKYRVSPKKFSYTYDDHKYLVWHTKALFDSLKEKLLALDPGVKEEVTKLYIAFKYDTNFVDIVFQKQRLRISVNMKYSEVSDPNGICKDITGLGRWGNGDVELYMEHTSDVDQVMEIIEQSYKLQAD